MGSESERAHREEILDHLKRLEDRVARIETHLNLVARDGTTGDTSQPRVAPAAEDAEEKLELQIGQNWFAKVGIVVLALGVVFLLTFPYQDLPPIVPSALGYVLVCGILILSYYWRESFPQISRYLLGGGLLLLYFTTLRLSHFSAAPALASKTLELVLLLIVVTINLVVSVRRESVSLIGISVALGYLTALAYGQSHTVFALVTIFSGVTVYIQRRLRLNAVPLLGILLSNMTHALWAINNPFFGNELQVVSSPEVNLLFVLMYSLIFAGGTLLRHKDVQEHGSDILSAFLNGLGSYALFLLLTLGAFPAHVVSWHVLASIVYLALSIAFWIRQKSRYATFVYAMLGYTALSVAITAQFKMPDYFVWLCWQSVLVLSTAVWFRSRFIVVANFAIYLIVFTAYLFTAGAVSIVSISFGIVALVSARILNWKRDRLELRTEMMRNAYLACALFVVPYALYHSVPAGYVSLSWLLVALLYYLFSRALHNKKYRWMALLTTLLTIFYVTLVDLVGVDPTLRVVSFLVLGSALLAISMFYSRRKHQPGKIERGSTEKSIKDPA